MVVESCRSRLVAVIILPITSDCDKKNVVIGSLFAEATGNLIAVHSGQTDIQQHDIGSMSLERFECRKSRVSYMRGVTRKTNQKGQCLSG